MNTDIRYLQLLEDDLAQAARVEHERETRESEGIGSPPNGPRRLPRRGGRWPAIAAAFVAVLVLAGSIGFLAQGGGQRRLAARADFGASASKAPALDAVIPGEAEVPAPSPEPAPGGARSALTDGSVGFESDGASDELFNDGVQGTAPGFGAAADSLGQIPGPQQDLTKIVRDGRIDVVVANGDFDQKVTSVTRIAGTNGGIVLTSSTRDGRAGTFTLRIPSRRFDTAMDQLRALGTVKADEVTGQDVTAEFIDLQTRLAILTDRRELLRELQADATSSAEILRFATLIDDVQFEIERIQGNLNFLKDQVAEATIRVSLREQDAPEAEQQQNVDVDKPSLSTSIDYAVQGFLRVLGAVVVGLGYLIPLSVIALAIWLIFRQVGRRGREAS
jgi:hypothetical protein